LNLRKQFIDRFYSLIVMVHVGMIPTKWIVVYNGY